MGFTSTMFDFFCDIGALMSALIGLLLALIVLRLMKYRKYKLPPGPPGYPLLGNILAIKDKEMHRQFVEWSKTYGPVISVYFGPQLNIVLNNTEVILEALVKKQDDFACRPRSASLDVMSDGGRSIAFGEGAAWKLHRMLSSKAIRMFLRGSKLEEKIHTNMAAIGKLIKKEAGAINPIEYVQKLIINIICGGCFGHSYDFDDEEMKQISKIITSFSDSTIDSSGFFLEDIIPLLHYCPTKTFKQMKQTTGSMYNFIRKKIVQRRNSLMPESIRDLTDALLVAQAEEGLQNSEAISLITDTHIVHTVADILFAGIDTTKQTLTFALKYMAAYPDVQHKMQEEIENVVGSDRFPGITDNEQLHYTNAVIHEVLRLHPTVPLALPHKTTCDTTVGGFDIPKDTTVFVNLWAMHHDADQWDHVEEFRPERFLDNHGKMAPKPQSWLPFSAGRRVCLGEAVAKMELILLLASFMQMFNIRFPDGVTPDMTDNTSFLTLCPKPFEIILEERRFVDSLLSQNTC